MPLNKYFKGKGEEVMSSMKKKYGDKKGKQVFYATANKKKMTPGVETGPSERFKKSFGKAAKRG